MTHRGGVKALSDEQLEAGIEMIQSMLAARDAGASAEVIEGEAVPALPPAPESKPRRKRKRSLDVVVSNAEPASD